MGKELGQRFREASMGNSKLVKIIVPIITAVLCIAALAIAGLFIYKAIKDSSRSLDKEKERIEVEYKELGEKNIDPENGKTILTENYLAKEYKKFYATRKSGGTLFRNIVLVFGIGFAAIVIITSLSDSIMGISKGRGIKLRSIISVVILIPVLIGGSIVFKKLIARNMPPEPGQETIKLYQVNVLNRKTEEKVTTDSDGDRHTTTVYYLILDDNGTRKNRQVTSDIYYSAEKPGIYIFVQAEGNDKVFDVGIYNTNEYEA